MGRYYRSKPRRLAEKLLEIRTALGLSQNQMIRQLGLSDVITQSRISGYELGTREPSLPTLLEYGRAAGVCLDVLVDDKNDLPRKLPSTPAHRGLKVLPAKSRGSKKR
jgi:transcriptional regulator with XRE-family HTH domain